ncbi:MAG: lipoyl(octanoyl) transferase LipB [Anaerohalosphaeraceae bacterium]|nr:lipoyl(octanoyl) transferase LipB [Anaerohalosphaeraceae bacterium]
MEIINLGITDYRKALSIQTDFVQQRIAGQISDKIVVLEHPPTITLGARRWANKLLADTESLSKKGIDVVKIGRGGGATAHNPGQLVVYPIVNLKARKLGISEFVRQLEAIGIELLSEFGLKCERKKGLPGLWVGEKKIASIGIKVKKWTTYHGMAINIENDLSIFDFFVPCGLDGVVMTSLTEQVAQKADINKARKALNIIIKKHFDSGGTDDR